MQFPSSYGAGIALPLQSVKTERGAEYHRWCHQLSEYQQSCLIKCVKVVTALP